MVHWSSISSKIRKFYFHFWFLVCYLSNMQIWVKSVKRDIRVSFSVGRLFQKNRFSLNLPCFTFFNFSILIYYQQKILITCTTHIQLRVKLTVLHVYDMTQLRSNYHMQDINILVMFLSLFLQNWTQIAAESKSLFQYSAFIYLYLNKQKYHTSSFV